MMKFMKSDHRKWSWKVIKKKKVGDFVRCHCIGHENNLFNNMNQVACAWVTRTYKRQVLLTITF